MFKQQLQAREERSSASWVFFFTRTCVYLYGNIQDELQSQNTVAGGKDSAHCIDFFFFRSWQISSPLNALSVHIVIRVPFAP